MTFIVNLSAIHTLDPVSKNLAAFTEICNRYSKSCFSSCPGLFSWTNHGWVAYQYYSKYKSLIEPYKLGHLDSNQFLENLVTLFSFLHQAELDEDALIEQRLNVHFSSNVKHALLEEAWNAGIRLDETAKDRFPLLVDRQEPVYLVSNSNELNVLAILALLKAQNPTIKFTEDIDLSVTEDQKPIEIAPNIYLCLSYRFRLFKTASQNNSVNPHSTMSLLKHLVENEIKTPKAEIQVVSQFADDLVEAEKIGLPKENLHPANLFFNPLPTEILRL